MKRRFNLIPFVITLLISVAFYQILLSSNKNRLVELANIAIQSQRDLFLFGDIRNAVARIDSAIGKNFTKLEVLEQKDGSNIILPSRAVFQDHGFFSGVIQLDLVFDSPLGEQGSLKFTFSTLKQFLEALAFLFALLTVTTAWVVISRKKLSLKHQEELRTQKLEVLGDLATQVAHDIRSPLAALTVVTSSLMNLPEDQRNLVRIAVDRIRDIANGLSKCGDRVAVESDSTQISRQLLGTIIDSIISENRTQHRSKLGIEIRANLQNSYGVCARVNPVEFKRVISNLLNNAVESISGKGVVTLSLNDSSKDKIEISISDTGIGISPEILPRLTKRGETHGKENGSGLGLFHAKECLESWGGSLKLESIVGQGTTITLTLPRTEVPKWLPEKISLTNTSRIVILDDDVSIHYVWRDRFEELKKLNLKGDLDLKVVHVSTPKDFIATIDDPSTLYLVDFELLGFSESGLDLIAEKLIEKRAILVTSRFEEPKVIERCQNLGVRLLPKSAASQIAIEIV